MHLTKTLNFSDHIKNAIQKANVVLNKISSLLRHDGYLSSENKMCLYKLFVRSVLTYGVPVWNNTSNTNIKKIQIIQNKCIRMALNLRPDPITYRQVTNQLIHEITGMETIKQFASRLTYKIYDVMKNHENQLMRNATELNHISSDSCFELIRQQLEL